MMAKKAIVIVVVAWAIGCGCFALALTPKERAKLKLVRNAVAAGIEHTKALQAAAEQARIEADNANAVALMAATSAFETSLKAKSALDEAARCQKENAEMRPIVKAVTGPWWFPGGRALLYGAKKSAISLVVIIAGVAVIGILLKFFAPGVLNAIKLGGKAAGGFFGKLGKRGLATVKRAGKAVVKKKPPDNIRHRTIGSDD